MCACACVCARARLYLRLVHPPLYLRHTRKEVVAPSPPWLRRKKPGLLSRRGERGSVRAPSPVPPRDISGAEARCAQTYALSGGAGTASRTGSVRRLSACAGGWWMVRVWEGLLDRLASYSNRDLDSDSDSDSDSDCDSESQVSMTGAVSHAPSDSGGSCRPKRRPFRVLSESFPSPLRALSESAKSGRRFPRHQRDAEHSHILPTNTEAGRQHRGGQTTQGRRGCPSTVRAQGLVTRIVTAIASRKCR